VEDGIISLDDLDVILAKEDPGFVQEMTAISQDQSLKNIEVEISQFDNLDEDKTIEESSSETKEQNQKSIGRIRKVFKTALVGFQKKINEVRLKAKTYITEFFKITIPKTSQLFWKNLKDFITLSLEKILYFKNKWVDLPTKLKKGLLTSFLFSIILMIAIYFSIKNNWIPQISQPMITSLASRAQNEHRVGENESWFEVYRAFPQKEYFILLDKVVVNLKRQNSFENPMTVIEFYLELDSHDTAVEIEDRKVEILDMAQRTVEEFTYEEISSKTGILRLKSNLRSEINNVLNQGRVLKVYINTIVTKK
jgi:flagellar basal body-associated protein FliL